MAELGPDERRHLIAAYVDQARINWAHVGIAQLMRAGFVDRVLTTNFDMLVARACALVGHFPAVYDLAASQQFAPSFIPDSAVFYLHGQRHGFVLLNTPDEVKKHSKLLDPVFRDIGSGRVWIVVGYSGRNDPVFEHLARVPRFDNKLYWVGYGDEPPASHVRDQLLNCEKYAFYVSGQDADDFFVRLCQFLNTFPPDLISKPFTHLDSMLSTLAPYTIPGNERSLDVTARPRELIRMAIGLHEARSLPSGPSRIKRKLDLLRAQRALMAGHYRTVISMYRSSDRELDEDARDTVAWAYTMRGDTLAARAKSAPNRKADTAFAGARNAYKLAHSVNPRRYEALNNLGAVLCEQAARKPAEEALPLYEEAIRAVEQALSVSPNDPWTLNNLGNALAAYANRTTGAMSDRLFDRALGQYRTALALDPGKSEIHNSWGTALSNRGSLKSGAESDCMLREAEEQFRQALVKKPDDHWARKELARVLLQRAHSAHGVESDHLVDEAVDLYRAVSSSASERHLALEHWANALAQQALRKPEPEGAELIAMAEQMFKASLETKPDHYFALNGWGYALQEYAAAQRGELKAELLRRSCEKYEASLAIHPADNWALHNWARALGALAKGCGPEEAAVLRMKAVELFERASRIDPWDAWALHHYGHFLLEQANETSEDR